MDNSASIIKPLLRNILTNLLELLSEDQLLHFKKIHYPVAEMKKNTLIDAIRLVERTLNNDDIDYIDCVRNAADVLNLNEEK